MTTPVLRVRAIVQMQSEDTLKTAKPLRAGWGPVIAYRDEFFPGRILECEPPIAPGQRGEAVIGIMGLSPDAMGFEPGTIFELRDGPKNVIATATVTDIEHLP
jgi:hypothetical protein